MSELMDVLRDIFHDELEGFIRHPGVHEGRKVKGGRPIELRLIMEDLVRSSAAYTLRL